VKARLAASLLFHLIEYPTSIDSLSDFGIPTDIEGNIQIRNIYFAYPSRPGITVLNGLNIDIKKGQKIVSLV
jgi:ABC-type multidrug transport system fused ATPase/permease subunit